VIAGDPDMSTQFLDDDQTASSLGHGVLDEVGPGRGTGVGDGYAYGRALPVDLYREVPTLARCRVLDGVGTQFRSDGQDVVAGWTVGQQVGQPVTDLPHLDGIAGEDSAPAGCWLTCLRC
jgi:hypothetical protein